jgi:hypothetical protein
MKFIRLLLLLLLIGVPILFLSCQKTTQIGQNVLPASDLVNSVTTDTMTVWAKEEVELPVQTNTLSNYLLGSMKDPIFGTSYAGIFTQVSLLGDGVSFTNGEPDSVVIDSMVLSLPFYTAPAYYGIQNVPQTIKVYRVTQSMIPGTNYYSNQVFSYDPTPIGAKTFIPNVASYALDSPTVLGLKQVPQLRIKLSSEFVQTIMAQSGTGTFATPSTFQNFLKGLYIAPDTSNGFGGGIMYMDLSTYSSILVYFKTGKSNTTIVNNEMAINSSCVITDYYKHNYKGTPVQALLNSNANNDSVLYLQSMCGLRARITIPYLQKLGKVLINKAEIEAAQLYRNPTIIDTNFSAPNNLEILTDSLNNDYLIEDFNNGFLSYGGTKVKIPYASNDSIGEYTISLADQLQYILTGNPTNTTINYSQFTSLFLRTYPNAEIANRIVVGGSNAKNYKLVLHLIYTKIN